MGITRNILQKKAVMKKIILCVAVAAAFWAVGCGGRDSVPKTPAADALAETALDTPATAAEAEDKPAPVTDTTGTLAAGATETDDDVDDASHRRADNVLIKDLDGDNIPDSVYFNEDTAMIVCRLSSSNFNEIRSKPIDNIYISNTKNGFEVRIVEHRAGYGNKFRYDPKSKRVRLIGMSRYEFGNAANDGSGESSVNLLTGDYIGNWNYDDYDTLIRIPTIRAKLTFPIIYLEDFDYEIYFNDYADKCYNLYKQHKKQHRNRSHKKALEGHYSTDKDSMDTVKLAITKNGDEYRYEVITPTRKLRGKVKFFDDNDYEYLTLQGIQWTDWGEINEVQQESPQSIDFAIGRNVLIAGDLLLRKRQEKRK